MEVVARAHDAVKEGLEEARSIMSLTEGGVVSWDSVVDAWTIEVDGATNALARPVTSSVRNDGSARIFSVVEAHTIRRVAREALTNAIKYGGARVRCTLAVEGGEASLTVADEPDGLGSDDHHRGDGTRRGLGIAERRVGALGGTLSITSRPGETTVRAHFPLQFGLSSTAPAAVVAAS